MSHLHQARSFVRGVRSVDPSQEGEQRPVGGFSQTVSEASDRAFAFLEVIPVSTCTTTRKEVLRQILAEGDLDFACQQFTTRDGRTVPVEIEFDDPAQLTEVIAYDDSGRAISRSSVREDATDFIAGVYLEHERVGERDTGLHRVEFRVMMDIALED